MLPHAVVFRMCGLASVVVPLAASAFALFAPLARHPMATDDQAVLRGGQACQTTPNGTCTPSGNCVALIVTCSSCNNLCLTKQQGDPCYSGFLGFNPNDTCKVPNPPPQNPTRCTTGGDTYCTAHFDCFCSAGGTNGVCTPFLAGMIEPTYTDYCMSK